MFTLDRSGPEFQVISPLREGTHGLEPRLIGTVFDLEGLASASYCSMGANPLS